MALSGNKVFAELQENGTKVLERLISIGCLRELGSNTTETGHTPWGLVMAAQRIETATSQLRIAPQWTTLATNSAKATRQITRGPLRIERRPDGTRHTRPCAGASFSPLRAANTWRAACPANAAAAAAP
jgi:hypothetical protein